MFCKFQQIITKIPVKELIFSKVSGCMPANLLKKTFTSIFQRLLMDCQKLEEQAFNITPLNGCFHTQLRKFQKQNFTQSFVSYDRRLVQSEYKYVTSIKVYDFKYVQFRICCGNFIIFHHIHWLRYIAVLFFFKGKCWCHK